jgi:hypothetical protein
MIKVPLADYERIYKLLHEARVCVLEDKSISASVMISNALHILEMAALRNKEDVR